MAVSGGRERVNAELLAAYASLFVGRPDAYAMQRPDGSYVRASGPLTLNLLAGHLQGRWTLGTYVLDQASTCTFAVFDADDAEEGLDWLAVLARALSDEGVPTLLEASRRGGHLWVFFSERVPARLVRAWLVPYAEDFHMEFYPKQDELRAGGLGSLIRLPLGIHRKSRAWYPFLELLPPWQLAPVGETVAACAAWAVGHAQRVEVPEQVARDGRAERGHLSGGSPSVVSACSSSVQGGSVGAIRAWCRAHDIRGVIGRYVELDERGVSSCPFKAHHAHGDRRPSFQVFAGADPHWYCYTWRRAGDLFDFLCLYHGLSKQEGWTWLQAGRWG